MTLETLLAMPRPLKMKNTTPARRIHDSQPEEAAAFLVVYVSELALAIVSNLFLEVTESSSLFRFFSGRSFCFFIVFSSREGINFYKNIH